jgi:hypothetical protein
MLVVEVLLAADKMFFRVDGRDISLSADADNTNATPLNSSTS